MHVVVIGNGIAGNTAALSAIRISHALEVTVISEEKTSLYSPCVFPHFICGDIEKQRLFLDGQRHRLEANLKLLCARAMKIDSIRKEVILEGGEHVDYDRIVIATGSRPAMPCVEGLGLGMHGIFRLKTVEDAYSLREYEGRNVAVIGSGAVGVEAAVSLQRRGCDVCLIESENGILPRLLDEDIASKVKEILEAHGVRVFTGEMLKRILGVEKVQGIVTSHHKLECDAVLLATGMKPRNELVKDTGIATGRSGGILTDSYMKTSVQDVYACGDCIETQDIPTSESRLSLLWRTAQLQGYVAGCNCAGITKQYTGSLGFTILEIFGSFVISSGNTQRELQDKRIALFETDSLNGYLRVITAGNRLLGLQSIGEVVHRDIGAMLGLISTKADVQKLARLSDLRQRIPHVEGAYEFLVSLRRNSKQNSLTT